MAAFVNMVINISFQKRENFLTIQVIISFSRKILHHGDSLTGRGRKLEKEV